MQLLLVCDQWVPGIRPVHCKPQPSRRDTHALLARYAGPDCHRKRYQPRPRKWGSELAKYVRSCLGPVLALSGSELILGCLRLDSDRGPHTSLRADRVRDQSGYVLWLSHTREKLQPDNSRPGQWFRTIASPHQLTF